MFFYFLFLLLTKIKILAFTGHACDQLHFALKIKVFKNKNTAKCFASETKILKRKHCSVTLTAVLYYLSQERVCIFDAFFF